VPAPARRLLGSALARLRADGVLSLQVLKTAVATGLAYQLGRLTGSPFPVFAALAALLVVQVTVYESVSRGLQRIAGVVLGVVVAFGLAQLLGLHAWTVGLVVLLGIVVARVLHVGEGGGVQVPVSGLLVLTVGSTVGSTTGSYALDRIVETVLGAAVGIVVNVVLAPPTRTRDAGRRVLALAEAQAAVLRSAGAGLAAQDWGSRAPGWLEEARSHDAVLTAARAAVEQGETSLRYNPRGQRLAPAAVRRRVALQALEHVAVQVRGVARTLVDSVGESMPVLSRAALGQALGDAGAALTAYGAVAAEPTAHSDSPQAASLRAALATARTSVAAAVAAARQLPGWAEGAWLSQGSILTDLDRLLGELDGRSQAALLQARLEPRQRRSAAARGRVSRGRRPRG